MADREIYVGNTVPDVELSLSDRTGILDLTTAHSMAARFEVAGGEPSFGTVGVAAPIDPPIIEEDEDGVVHVWNFRYTFGEGDTDIVGDYKIYVDVTWYLGSPDGVETYPTDDVLHILLPD